jgi:hypothetical protein
MLAHVQRLDVAVELQARDLAAVGVEQARQVAHHLGIGLHGAVQALARALRDAVEAALGVVVDGARGAQVEGRDPDHQRQPQPAAPQSDAHRAAGADGLPILRVLASGMSVCWCGAGIQIIR